MHAGMYSLHNLSTRTDTQWKHHGCWCLGGGTEAIPHEANLSLQAYLLCMLAPEYKKWEMIAVIVAKNRSKSTNGRARLLARTAS